MTEPHDNIREQIKLLAKSVSEIKNIMKLQDTLFKNSLNKLPENQRKKYSKMMVDAKNGKLGIADIQKIINDSNKK